MVQIQDLRFRDAVPEDAKALADLGRDTFVETFGALYQRDDLEMFLSSTFAPSKQSEEIYDPDTEIRVVEAAGRMVAYCKIGPVKLPIDTGDRKAMELHRIYVSEALQGVGVGRILLNWAIQSAKRQGVEDFYLGVWSGNERAIAVYEGRNFEKVGEYDFPVGRHIDREYIMRRRMDADMS